MSEETHLSPEERELVESLAGLVPAPPGASEQAVWYEAGLRAGRRRERWWMGAAAAAIVMSAGLAVVRPKPGTVYVERTAPAGITAPGRSVVAAVPGPGRSDYLRLREAVEQRGLEAVSEPPGAGALVQPTLRAASSRGVTGELSPWNSVNTEG